MSICQNVDNKSGYIVVRSQHYEGTANTFCHKYISRSERPPGMILIIKSRDEEKSEVTGGRRRRRCYSLN